MDVNTLYLANSFKFPMLLIIKFMDMYDVYFVMFFIVLYRIIYVFFKK